MPGYDAGASRSLVGEYDGSGNLIQETVWLGAIPVATLRPNGSSAAIYYVDTDHLGIPREIIRPSDNTVMWSRFLGPFGTESPNTNPQGAGTYDLRFPGQIAGAWGSTLQNTYRDYDPAVGRFVESDPIGLEGHSYSTYVYANGNPVSLIDPYGWSSIDAAIVEAVASGNVEALETLAEVADPEQAKVIQAALQRLNSTADQIISKECKASVRSHFPKSVLNNTLAEIKELAQGGDSDAKTAWKLLNDNRFKK